MLKSNLKFNLDSWKSMHDDSFLFNSTKVFASREAIVLLKFVCVFIATYSASNQSSDVL